MCFFYTWYSSCFFKHRCKRGKINEFKEPNKKIKYHMCMIYLYFSNCWQPFWRNHCLSSCWQQEQQSKVSVIFPREIVLLMTLDNDWVWHPIRSVILLPSQRGAAAVTELQSMLQDPGGNQSSKLAWESLSISVRMYVHRVVCYSERRQLLF